MFFLIFLTLLLLPVLGWAITEVASFRSPLFRIGHALTLPLAVLLTIAYGIVGAVLVVLHGRDLVKGLRSLAADLVDFAKDWWADVVTGPSNL